MTCRLRISIDSGVNASRLSAHCIHWLSSCHVSITAENAIAPSPTCFGRIVKRGVRIGIGTSIRTGLVLAMLHDTKRQEKPRTDGNVFPIQERPVCSPSFLFVP